MRYQMADGTWVDEDASGNVTVVAGPDGGTPPSPDSSIVRSFMGDVLGGLGAAIRRDFALGPAPSPARPAPAAGLSPQARNILLLVAAAWLAKKFFA